MARQDIIRLRNSGKTVKLLFVGRKGWDVLRREFEQLTVDRVDLKEVRQIGFVNAEDISQRVLDLFEAGEFDVCTMYFSEFKSVISQVPDAASADPGEASGRR